MPASDKFDGLDVMVDVPDQAASTPGPSVPLLASDEEIDVQAWLTQHGVSKRKAEQFLDRAPCRSLRTLAVYLRLQVPPLEYANTDSINTEMLALLGLRGKGARSLLNEAGLQGAAAKRCSIVACRCDAQPALYSCTHRSSGSPAPTEWLTSRSRGYRRHQYGRARGGCADSTGGHRHNRADGVIIAW